MKDKEHSLGSKLLGLFVAEEGAEILDGAEQQDEALPEMRSGPDAVRPSATSRPAPSLPRATGGGTDPLNSADFEEIYAKICESGDPSTDAILTAYVEMSKTLADGVLLTAMNSMIKGIRADIGAVRETVAQRCLNLQNVVEQKKSHFANSRNGRARELNEKHATVKAQIQQLQTQITALNDELRRCEADIQQADASDMGTMEAFNQRASSETSRLAALGRFLELVLPAKRG